MTDELELLRLLRHDRDLEPALLTRERRNLMTLIERPALGGRPAGLPRIIPHLIYDDVAGAIEWLCRAFGFRERTEMRMLEPDGSIGHAELEVGDALLMLGPPSVHGSSPRRGVSAMIHVYVEDVDRHFQRARAAGAAIVLEPEDQPWGDRRYQATDPEGHHWHFATRTPRGS
jgi:PhnB protein